MEALPILFVIGFVVLFGVIIFVTLRSSQQEQKKKQQLAESLGFSPLAPDEVLIAKISRLYWRKGAGNRYQLRNVSRKPILDGEMYLFDLVETSGEDDSWTERQAVALLSSTLLLPPFWMFPKADQKYALSGLANKLVEWGITLFGEPVAFPEYPGFSARYVLVSNEPEQLRVFFDARLAQYFAQTQMYTLHAGQNIFTFAEMDPQNKALEQPHLAQRVNTALEIYRQLQK